MKVITIPCGPLQANMYILYHEDSGQALVIDPIDVRLCEENLKRYSLSVCGIFLTHGHFDHAYQLEAIKNLTAAPSYIHLSDAELLNDPHRNASFMLRPVDLGSCDRMICDDTKIDVGDFSVQVMHMPGHTSGSVCYLIENVMFSGDTVFADGIGRCDLFGGSISQMRESLQKLGSIQKNYPVYPGHGPSASLQTIQPQLKYYL